MKKVIDNPNADCNVPDDTKEALEYLDEMYIECRECGHPLTSDAWDDVLQDLDKLNYNASVIKNRFDELCNL